MRKAKFFGNSPLFFSPWRAILISVVDSAGVYWLGLIFLPLRWTLVGGLLPGCGVGQLQLYGALAQLVARYIRIVEVSGSNPLCSTIPDGIAGNGSLIFSIFDWIAR